ncbi:MAG TPA: hypothetical protein VHT72_07265 [Puia sp.]|nr:hypothetical protein [Puia sp.]
MKKSIICIALILSITSVSVFAGPVHQISKRVEAEFHKRFLNAEDVQWDEPGDFDRATFRINESVLFAYFNPDGELIAVTRNILSDQLPIPLMITLKSNYSTYWIVELFEVHSNGDTHYYVTLNNADQELVFKSEGDEWKVFDEEKE